MKKILINYNPWQTRIVVMRGDLIENIYFQTPSRQSLERSYFKGLVSKVLPGIQTAFIDIGQPRSGFLHISEIDRDLAIKRMTDQLEDFEDSEERVENTKSQFDISKILKEKEKILVQVSKEPVYEKGAKLTTCFTLPGRFLVLMPNIPRIGISKKIESKEERQRLRDLVAKGLPEGMGVIIRTSSEDKKDSQLLQDLSYLLDTWKQILKKYEEAKSGEKVYEDIELTLQVIRDYLDDDVEIVLCDSKELYERLYKFARQIAPEQSFKVKFYEEPPTLFEKFNLEKQIAQALEKKVQLKSGGSLIIETTEAMTVIDVNTGKYIGEKDLEETLLKTNLDAAEEIVRQLRLRNIGGLIVIDFIDMASNANRQKLYRFLEKTLKERDRFQSVVLKVSEFGLVQMTRKRSGRTLVQQMTEVCQVCSGLGHIRSIQTETFFILRKLRETISNIKTKEVLINIAVHPLIFNYITNKEYTSVLELEKLFKCKIIFCTHEHPERNIYNISINE